MIPMISMLKLIRIMTASPSVNDVVTEKLLPKLIISIFEYFQQYLSQLEPHLHVNEKLWISLWWMWNFTLNMFKQDKIE